MTRRKPRADNVVELADCKLSASTSFSADEVAFLDVMLAILRRGGSMPPAVQRADAVASLSRKVPAMKAQIERNRATRDRVAAARRLEAIKARRGPT